MKKKKKQSSKHVFRFFLALIVFGTITGILGYNLVCNVITIGKMNLQKKELNIKLAELEKEKEELETDVIRLNDPEYIAKYVREKYYYSKDGEVILKIDD